MLVEERNSPWMAVEGEDEDQWPRVAGLPCQGLRTEVGTNLFLGPSTVLTEFPTRVACECGHVEREKEGGQRLVPARVNDRKSSRA